MKRATCVLITHEGERCQEQVWLTSVPGLAAWQNPLTGNWNLIHTPSGKRIYPTMRKREHAEVFVQELAPLTDWTQDGDTIGDDVALYRRAMKAMRVAWAKCEVLDAEKALERARKKEEKQRAADAEAA